MLKKLIVIFLLLSSNSQAVELSIGNTVSTGGYVADSVNLRIHQEVYHDNMRIDIGVRAKNSDVAPFASLLYSDNSKYVKVGTYDEFYGFLARDDVSFTGLAILPQGVYQQDFINGGFSLANGVSGGFWNALGKHRLDVSMALGKPYILNYDDYEDSLLSGTDTWLNLEEGVSKSFHISYQYGHNFTLMFARNMADVRVVKQWEWGLKDVYLAKNKGKAALILSPDYTIDIKRLGVRVGLSDKTEIVIEKATLEVVNDMYDIPGSNNYYIVMYHSLNSQYEVTMGYSEGAPEGRELNNDVHVGINTKYGKIMGALEYHHVRGKSWFNDTPNSNDNNVFVLTWSYKI